MHAGRHACPLCRTVTAFNPYFLSGACNLVKPTTVLSVFSVVTPPSAQPGCQCSAGGFTGGLGAVLSLAGYAQQGRMGMLTYTYRGFCILAGLVNSGGSKLVGRIAAFASWWTLGGTVVLVVTLLVKAPHKNEAHFVFFDYEDYTGWGNRGFVVILGFLQAVYALEGAETR